MPRRRRSRHRTAAGLLTLIRLLPCRLASACTASGRGPRSTERRWTEEAPRPIPPWREWPRSSTLRQFRHLPLPVCCGLISLIDYRRFAFAALPGFATRTWSFPSQFVQRPTIVQTRIWAASHVTPRTIKQKLYHANRDVELSPRLTFETRRGMGRFWAHETSPGGRKTTGARGSRVDWRV